MEFLRDEGSKPMRIATFTEEQGCLDRRELSERLTEKLKTRPISRTLYQSA